MSRERTAIRRWGSAFASVVVVAAAVAAATEAWLLWAHATYPSSGGCPWDGPQGWKALIAGFVCCGLAAGIGGLAISKLGSSRSGIPAGVVIVLVAALSVAIVALFFGAGLQCND